jgi:hypothetical protein
MYIRKRSDADAADREETDGAPGWKRSGVNMYGKGICAGDGSDSGERQRNLSQQLCGWEMCEEEYVAQG